MPYFFCKLIPPRSTFSQDMTAAEAQVLREHVAYWTDWMEKGHVVAFGPVAEPAGGYGIAIVRFDNAAAIEQVQQDDPTIRAQLGFRWQTFPMPQVVTPRR